MNFYQSLSGKTLLCPTNSQPFLHLLLAKHQVMNAKVLSLETWLNSFDFRHEPSTIQKKLSLHHQMKAIAPALQALKNICTTPSFEAECLHFLNNAKGFGIDLSTLPDQNTTQKELKLILNSLVIESENEHLVKRVHALNETLVSSVVIAYRQPDDFEAMLINELIQKGAQSWPFEQRNTVPSFYHAANQRQEVEAAIQKILTDKLNCDHVQFCLLDTGYKPLVKQLLDRYQLPYTFVSEPQTSNLALQAAGLLRFILDDSQENFLTCLNNQCFSRTSTPFLIQTLSLFNANWNDSFPDLNALTLSYTLVSQKELEPLAYCIDKANQERAELLPAIQTLLESSDFKTLFTQLDTLLALHAQKDPRAYKRIQQFLKDALPLLEEKDDLYILISELETMRTTQPLTTLQGIIINETQDLFAGCDTLFTLGATQKNFPGFSPASGIFDENFLALIPNYPTLDSRYQHFIKNQTSLFHYADTLILSYPLSNYEGKPNEASLEVENFMKTHHIEKSTSYPLIQKDAQKQTYFQLSPDTAHKLYLNEQKEIFGSVSSLERYAACPYAYFLKTGLKVPEPSSPGFNDQKIGTLSHYILETLVQRYGKQYAQANEQEIRTLIKEQCDELNLIYPHLNFKLIAQKELFSIMNNLKQLDAMEAHSSLIPTQSEAEFFHEYPIGGGVTLKLKGIIDRIDENERFFRILDYKSSKKKLMLDKFATGQQLQLVTYAMHSRNMLNKEVLGAFYYSFKNENFALPYGKIKRRGGAELIETDHETIELEQKKANRLQGWIFSDFIEEMDNEGLYVAGVKNSPKSGITATQVIDVRVLTHLLEQIMSELVKQILSGRIDCQPVDGACLFCKYKPICRFKGNIRTPQPLVEVPENLIPNKKGSESDE